MITTSLSRKLACLAIGAVAILNASPARATSSPEVEALLDDALTRELAAALTDYAQSCHDLRAPACATGPDSGAAQPKCAEAFVDEAGNELDASCGSCTNPLYQIRDVDGGYLDTIGHVIDFTLAGALASGLDRDYDCARSFLDAAYGAVSNGNHERGFAMFGRAFAELSCQDKDNCRCNVTRDKEFKLGEDSFAPTTQPDGLSEAQQTVMAKGGRIWGWLKVTYTLPDANASREGGEQTVRRSILTNIRPVIGGTVQEDRLPQSQFFRLKAGTDEFKGPGPAFILQETKIACPGSANFPGRGVELYIALQGPFSAELDVVVEDLVSPCIGGIAGGHFQLTLEQDGASVKIKKVKEVKP